MSDVNTFEINSSLFKAGYALSIRIWHWLTFLTFTASIVMVLFASTIFTMKDNIPMVQEQVQQKGGAVTPEQARAVAHEYSDKLWMLHKYIGYGLCFLFLLRIVIEVTFSSDQKLAGKIKKAVRFQGLNMQQKGDKQHYLLVKWGYVIFYTLFFIMALTGLGLAYEDVPIFKNNHKLIVNIHSFVQYLIYFYILSHIVGVVRADVTDNKGIVSSMINGGTKANS